MISFHSCLNSFSSCCVLSSSAAACVAFYQHQRDIFLIWDIFLLTLPRFHISHSMESSFYLMLSIVCAPSLRDAGCNLTMSYHSKLRITCSYIRQNVCVSVCRWVHLPSLLQFLFLIRFACGFWPSSITSTTSIPPASVLFC